MGDGEAARGQQRVAVVVGATGLVGRSVVEQALAEPRYREVRALVRRDLEVEHPKLDQQWVDFERLASRSRLLAVDDVFCCLGTTLAKAGSAEAFRRVDHDYVVTVARLAREGGAERFVLVSAVGADSGSRVLYSRVKGETEDAVAALAFSELHVLRPSLLLGEREERRPLERAGMMLGRWLGGLLIGPLRPLRPVASETVAAAMVAAAGSGRRGRTVYTYSAICRLAAGGL